MLRLRQICLVARELALPWRRELGAGEVPERFVERAGIGTL